jgi:DNA repair protein RadC
MTGGEKKVASLPIPEWLEEERPREELLSKGTESLSLSKLLAVILRTGRKGVNAEDLARRLLRAFTSLRGVDAASVSEIRSINGMGPAKTAQIKAALEIGKRLCREKARSIHRIESPHTALRYVETLYGPYLRDTPHELAYLIMLNRRRMPVRSMELERGGFAGVAVDPTRIVREAVRAAAPFIVLVHNHPSGDSEPSTDDVAATDAVRDACALFGIRLLDHIIVGGSRKDNRSFALAGLL